MVLALVENLQHLTSHGLERLHTAEEIRAVPRFPATASCSRPDVVPPTLPVHSRQRGNVPAVGQ